MSHWEHLSEVRDDVKATMCAEFIKYEKQDLGIGIVVDGMYHDKDITQRISAILSSVNNRTRIPELCVALKREHPELSKRKVFNAIHLFCGLSEIHVTRLYYRSHPCSK